MRLLAATVDEGAGDLPSSAFQAALKDRSISLGFRAGMDATRATLMTLTDTSADAFRPFRLALTQPRFDREPVQRIRQQLLAAAQRKDRDPQPGPPAVVARGLPGPSLWPVARRHGRRPDRGHRR